VDDIAKPEVRIIAGDEGVWYLPERIRLTLQTADKATSYATWMSGETIQMGRSPRELVLPLRWTQQTPQTAKWQTLDTERGGDWSGACGATAAWLAGTPSAKNTVQNGFCLDLRRGTAHTWAPACNDARALAVPGAKDQRHTAACWFDPDQVACQITPANERPYRLTVYLLDYDRAKRSVEAVITDSLGERLDNRPVSVEQMGKGAYLTWMVTGKAGVALRYNGANTGANAVLSAVFIDQ
jgi:hypothetical protein